MSKVITLSVSASDPESDAPTVGDFIDQVRDYFELMALVEGTLAEDGSSVIDWRIVKARKNSPLTLEVQAFPKEYAVNIDQRAQLILSNTLGGLRRLAQEASRPQYFNDQALLKANRIFERVTNGFDRMTVEIEGGAPVVITPTVARASAKNIRDTLTPKGKPYRELGTIEGHVKHVDSDGYGRSILTLRHRLTGNEIKCIMTGEAKAEVSVHEIGDVWKLRRIEVFGTIHYRAQGKISQVEATRVRFLKARSELPDANAIIDPEFTGGLTSEEYLSRLHDGQ